MTANNFNKTRQTKRLALLCFFIPLALMILQACGKPSIPKGAIIIEDTAIKANPTDTPYVTPTIPAPDFLTATASALQNHSEPSVL